jgi:hypothetical protein
MQDLKRVVGAQNVALFGASTVDTIKIRRMEAHGQLLPFHVDSADEQTMQILLNDEHDFEGGRLVFVTKDSIVQPSRAARTATVHCNKAVVHGVSVMTSGVRYSMFLLKSSELKRRTDRALAAAGSIGRNTELTVWC